jgi:UDP:flavonoid glycosyltransferase YjiC (YdhE family)
MPPPRLPARQRETSAPPGCTILFTPASDILFHVGRCMRVARELAARGHRVVMGGMPRFLRDPALRAELDFEYLPLPDFSAQEGMRLLRSITARPPREQVERMIEAEIAALDRLRPDVVVTDFRPTAQISARACGVPIASLLLSHWTPEYANRPEWVPRSYPVFVWAERLLGSRLARRIATPGFRLAIRYKTAPLRAAARRRALPAPALLWELLRGDLNLLTDSPVLCPLPVGDAEHIGPIVWEPDEALPPRVAALDPERPLIFVNFGSTGHPELFQRVFDELGDERYQVVLASCGQIDPRDFAIPGNFVVERYVPLSRVLERADLVIYHGGAGTFQQSVLAGVPGIAIATHWDQEYAGFLSEHHGFGLFLSFREVLGSPGRLRASTEEVLATLGTRRARLERLRAALREHDGPGTAADRIEQLLARVAPGRARSA